MIRICLFLLLLMPASLALAQQKPASPLQLTPKPAPQTTPAPGATPPPMLNLPRSAPAPSPGFFKAPPVFTPAQIQTLNRISQFYNSMLTLAGDFTQVDERGRKVTGTFTISKPGKVRFQYNPPQRLEIVANGENVMVRDRRAGTQDVYPLWQTPLRYLLKSRIDLFRDARILSVLQDQDVVSVTIEEEGLLEQGKLTLFFGATDFALRQWSVTDAQNNTTDVSVQNLATNTPADPRLFSFDYVPPATINAPTPPLPSGGAKSNSLAPLPGGGVKPGAPRANGR